MRRKKVYAADPHHKDTRSSSRNIKHVIGTRSDTIDSLNVEPEGNFKDVTVSNENDSIAIAAAKEVLCLILGREGQVFYKHSLSVQAMQPLAFTTRVHD
jgi:hypothetical protein